MSDRGGGGRRAKHKKNETMNPKEPPSKLQKKVPKETQQKLTY